MDNAGLSSGGTDSQIFVAENLNHGTDGLKKFDLQHTWYYVSETLLQV